VEAVRYEPSYRSVWDDFIRNSKNGVFLFHRDYMEYHRDRFEDFSILFFDNGKLIAVMPANRSGEVLHSHGGLTFGGIVSGCRMHTALMLEVFDTLREYAGAQSLKKIIYKAVPYIYHRLPAQEDLYALYRCNAKLVRRDVTSCIRSSDRPRFDELRRRKIRKAKSEGVRVTRSYDFRTFVAILADVLQSKYGVKPTHTADEISLLAGRFPDNIKLHAAHVGGAMVAGVVIFESDNVAHAQYIAANEDGRRLGATDLVFDSLINELYPDKEYFDFGISTEDAGRFLNEGLVHYKESFRARSVVHDFYEMVLK
jgi:hypothetical protein